MGTTLRNRNLGGLGSTPAGTVDSVTVQLRSSGNPAVIVASQKMLLRNDGRVMNFTGFPILFFDTVDSSSYYVAVKQRNHVGGRSASAVVISRTALASWDFRTAAATADSDSFVRKLVDSRGRYAMFAGDADGNGYVQPGDINSVIRPALGRSGYIGSDLNLNGEAQNTDVNFYARPNQNKGVNIK